MANLFLGWQRLVCIVHAIIATVLWYVVVMLDQNVIPIRAWVALTLLWLFWFYAIARGARVDRRRWLWTLILGLAILSPTISTLYAIGLWTFGGFAP